METIARLKAARRIPTATRIAPMLRLDFNLTLPGLGTERNQQL
jgi:hypothetical protein